MPEQPPLSEEFLDTDPPTLFSSPPGEGLSSATGEWALIRYVGNPIGEVLPLRKDDLTIGRSPENDLCLAEVEVSRRHARIEVVGQEGQAPLVLLSDLGSTNGTFVNGRRVLPRNGPASLQNGDVMRVGTHAFKLKYLDEMERTYHEAVLVQSTVDSLTGLANRASVLDYLERHADLTRRHRRPLSLILCDLDHFKEVNDEHGHAAGDLVLKRFGQVALGRLRASDHVGRIGGEEFLVVLPETEGPEAVSVAEELRRALAEEVMEGAEGGAGFRVTCCFGVAQFRAEDADGGSLLARADVALYRAKALGRNRVEFDGRS
ncbi:GGDEF domain-containing protein [Mesoterricola sediminis]|uniref:diguanylate cyclase n=2 Tax=Mesoterricola sediminis TaxID=2927980 RepID=A0AA48GPW8_9BACT|nr:GGDEF domain-containing protein [Mesoterricola sediminis]